MTRIGPRTDPIAHFIAVLLISSLIAGCEADPTTQREADPEDPLAIELEHVITSWRAAVSTHDEEKIIDQALPEFRARVAKDLSTATSELNRYLFAGPDSLSGFFERPLRWKILPHPELRDVGRGTTVCYFDPASLAENESAVLGDLSRGHDPDAVRCFFLFFAEDRWFLSFEFAYPD